MQERYTPGWRSLGLVSLLTVFALAVHGFHPYVEDGGLYIAGIKKLLNPALYPAWTEFVTEHLHFSLFAPTVATIVRITHLSLASAVLLLYLAGIWLTLWSASMILARVTPDPRARAGGVALLTCWLTLPIAGTSLMLMDPYLTSRSLSTPLVLLAFAWALDGLRGRRIAWLFCAASILAAAVLHPLMGGYGFAALLILGCVSAGSPAVRRWGPRLVLASALLIALIVRANAPVESPTYVTIALTRYYWFPAAWQWYEQFGLAAPLVLLWWLGRRNGHGTGPWRAIAQTGIILGAIALSVALLFARESSATHLVARLQPLRSFQVVYELMIMLLGAWLGERILKAHAWRWALMLAALGSIMFFVQRSIFPDSAHVEWPWAQPSNPWENAFLWARNNTPTNALFALDARYITDGPREDAQCFRPIAERSALADYAKDGGKASITPDLTTAWSIAQQAQTGLEQQTDATRLANLQPLGVSWVVLEAGSPTTWSCPYKNLTVKVCRLP